MTRFVLSSVLFLSIASWLPAADWPTWRYDAARSGNSPEKLPDPLHLLWARAYPPLVPAFRQVRQERLQFDRGYEPVVLGKTMLVGSSANDSVTAIDIKTGHERWRFYAEGPVRLAPAAADGRAYVASDDGCVYCLDVASGAVHWKQRVVPSSRKVLGNGRMISLWPVRGGPLVHDGVVYVAAGVWPFEGIFVAAFDARSGAMRWCNDRTGALYLVHPHNAVSFGGPSPQGYLLLHQGKIVAPSGRAFPAFFEADTGKLHDFDFGYAGHGSRPGSWFVITGGDGRLCVDPTLNVETHDAGDQVIGQPGFRRTPGEPIQSEIAIGKTTYAIREGVSRSIRAGGREYRFDQPPKEVQGHVHTMLAADGKLFVVTREGTIYAFGARNVAQPPSAVPEEPTKPSSTVRGESAQPRAAVRHVQRATGHIGPGPGYAMVWGLDAGRLAEELARQSKLDVIVVDPDAKKIDAFRRRMDAAGLYGVRVAALVGRPEDLQFPPYCVRLLMSETPGSFGPDALARSFHVLRPYGGAAYLAIPSSVHEAWKQSIARAEFAQARIERDGESTFVKRDGPLPGAADYAGRQNFDKAVRAPLGVLWFGDTHHHHKLFHKGIAPEAGRGLPQAIAVNHGVTQYTIPKQPLGANPKHLNYNEYLDFMYRMLDLQDVYTDVYTGRTLGESDARQMGFLPAVKAKEPPTAVFMVPSARRNPITGREEAREFLKTYGCDGFAVDYGNLFTMRSATAAFYDATIESGTINISGTRSGCRNNLVPADGLLNLPFWTGNCTCNYPIGTSLALVHVPEEQEQWSAWGPAAVAAPIQRVGINFGAPGDRMTKSGTLWLEHPSVGGPSPEVPVQVRPEQAEYFYRHAVWMRGGQGWPWVTASGVKGVRSIRIEPVLRKAPADGSFSVRWSGWLEVKTAGKYTFHLRADKTARLKIDAATLLDTAKNARRGQDGEVSAAWTAEAGRKYAIQLEYVRAKGASGDAFCELQWTPPQSPSEKGPIPAECLTSAQGDRGSSTGAYYDSWQLSGAALLQTDRALSFAWGRRLPPVLEKAAAPVTLKPRRFTVRLFFAEPEPLGSGQRVFNVSLQGRNVLDDFDVACEAGGPDRGVTREFRDVEIAEALAIEFTPRTDRPPLVCGVELIAQ